MHETFHRDIRIKCMRRIIAKEMPKWPKLAWYAEWNKHDDSIRVFHGDAVEVREDRFFEGVWDGDFEKGEFQHAPAFCGSGVVLKGHDVVLVPTFVPNERIYVTKNDQCNHQCASNSLLCWLTQTGKSLDSDWPDYYADLVEMVGKGHTDSLPEIRLANEGVVGAVELSPWVIGPEKSWRESPRKGPVFKPTFASYRTFLADTMRRLIANAESPLRKTKVHSVTSLSTGFDSVAVSALAVECGVNKGFTILGREDARSIAKKLGLKLRSKHRALTCLFSRAKTQEFHLLPIGHNRPSGLFESTLTDGMLFTGGAGDYNWSLSPGFKGDFLVRSEIQTALNGNSNSEFRLRVGCFFVAVPAIGQWHWPLTNEISNSAEMRLFRDVSSDKLNYSRPIPRRIGMEAGIERKDFGKRKVAGSIMVPSLFLGRSYFSFYRFLRRIEDVNKSSYPKTNPAFFQTSKYRWAIHWAHEALKDRYKIR